MVFALLHDINHFPISYTISKNFSNTKLAKIDLIDFYCNGKATNDSESIYDIIKDVGISPEFFKEILFSDISDIPMRSHQAIKSIIDSGIDVDKMTYVRDDSMYTGVPFGKGIDHRMLFENADIAIVNKRNYHLVFNPKALSAVENILISRYWNFRQIYWHHTNRAIATMISHVIDSIYGDRDADIQEYLIKSIHLSEVGAVIFLNEKYKEYYSKDSIIANIMDRRDHIYKRIFSVRRTLQ